MKNLFFFTALLFLFVSPSQAQIIKYRIIVETLDIGGSGTDNYIGMIMYGANGMKTDEFDLQGNHEGGQIDAFTFSHEDIGVIERIRLDVYNSNLLDGWDVKSVQILRDTDADDKRTADGYSEFSINKEMSFDPEYFNATFIKPPRVTVGPTGEPVLNEEIITIVSFGENPHRTESQMVMQYKEKWGMVERISASQSTSEEVSAYVSLSYQSPESVYGQFSAEAGAAWSKTFEEERTKESEFFQESEFDWSYKLPAQSVCFRKVKFKVPFEFQKFTDGDKTVVVRKLHAEIIPTGYDVFLFLPKVENNQIIPVLWQEVEEEWLSNIEPSRRDELVNSYLNKWLENGWVVMTPEEIIARPFSENKSDSGSVSTSTQSQTTTVQTIESPEGPVIIRIDAPPGVSYKIKLKIKKD